MINTLLIVDDEPNILKSLSRVFAEEGYEIYTAQNGNEGLQLLKEHPIQVIISDQRMPIMSGIEFLAYVKKLHPNIVCMILSGYADFETVQIAINEGLAYKFLNKPWDNEKLLIEVKQAFELYQKQMIESAQFKTDKLTGLLNRFGFSQFLNEYIKNNQEKKLAVLTLDLEGLKKINIAMNEKAGDEVLQTIAQRLRENLQCNNGNKIGRLGSSEFAFIMNDFEDDENLDKKLSKLIECLTEPVNIQNIQIFPKVNIGVSLFPKHGTQYDALIRYSNFSLKNSKLKGENIFQMYDPNLQKNESNSFLLETDLHTAVEKKQFILYYQAIVNKKSEVVGFEALVRWNHPTLGLLMPDKFIKILEESGLIIPLGRWILETACSDVQVWRNRGYSNLHVAVNVSAKQFEDPDFFQYIIDLLQRLKLNPSAIVLEITESELMQNIEVSQKALDSLKNLGVSISLDDFGTGYSSLEYLRLFPFKFLKIDRSFVQDMIVSKNTAEIITAIIAMCKSLGLSTIAEGIDTQEQSDILNKKQCDFQQGFLFYKPMPAENILTILSQSRRES